MIFSLALFPTIDGGALLRRTLSTGHQRLHSESRRLYVLMFISTSLKCIDVCPLPRLHLKIEMRCWCSLASFKKENGQENKHIFQNRIQGSTILVGTACLDGNAYDRFMCYQGLNVHQLGKIGLSCVVYPAPLLGFHHWQTEERATT